MSDTTTPQADAIRKGLSTSEGKLALLAFVVGTVLDGVVPLLQQEHLLHPDAVWVTMALVVAGLTLQVASVLGYTRARTAIKLAILAPSPVVNSAITVQAAEGKTPEEVAAAIAEAAPPVPGGD